MATIKISQLPPIASNVTGNALLPIVSTNGIFTTDKITINQLANYILVNAGNVFANANIATVSYNVVNSNQSNITTVGVINDLVTTGNITLAENISIEGSTPPLVAANTTIAYKIPIQIDGVTYYIALTTEP